MYWREIHSDMGRIKPVIGNWETTNRLTGYLVEVRSTRVYNTSGNLAQRFTIIRDQV